MIFSSRAGVNFSTILVNNTKITNVIAKIITKQIIILKLICEKLKNQLNAVTPVIIPTFIVIKSAVRILLNGLDILNNIIIEQAVSPYQTEKFPSERLLTR